MAGAAKMPNCRIGNMWEAATLGLLHKKVVMEDAMAVVDLVGDGNGCSAGRKQVGLPKARERCHWRGHVHIEARA